MTFANAPILPTFTLADIATAAERVSRLPKPTHAVTVAPDVLAALKEQLPAAESAVADGVSVFVDPTLPAGTWYKGPPRTEPAP